MIEDNKVNLHKFIFRNDCLSEFAKAGGNAVDHFFIFDNVIHHFSGFGDFLLGFYQDRPCLIILISSQSILSIDICLVHVIWTEHRMTNLVLNICFDFFSQHKNHR